MRRLLLVPLLLATACASPSQGPAAAVSAAEADVAVQRMVELAAQGDLAAMRELCPAAQCTGLSGSVLGEPVLAPGGDRPPRQVCAVPLPPTSTQAGPRLVVLQGERSDGLSYVGHVLLERVDGEVVAHEPGFWLGIRYTALAAGRAWSGAGDVPAVRADHERAALRACTDTAEWLAEVTGT